MTSDVSSDRLGAGSALANAIIGQAGQQPSKAPPTSLGDYLLRAVHDISTPLPVGRWGD